jgi:polyhydroxybutyrate depolymerase
MTYQPILIGILSGVLGAASGCARAELYPITADDLGGGGGVSNGTQSGSAGQVQSSLPQSCPMNALPAGDTSVSLKVGSLTRSYVLHVPTAYTGRQAVPLLVDFHSIGSSGWGELSSSRYPAVTDPEGVIIAFPDGLKGPAGAAWNMGPCCVVDVDDVAFTRAVVADVAKSACIDSKRVYAVGELTGAGLVHYLACHAADVLAAVAPADLDLLEENVADCKPTRPISVISFRSTSISRVPYEGGPSSLVPKMPVTFLGARATFERWAQLNGCSGSASPEDANGCSSYSGCRAGVDVVLCTVVGNTESSANPGVAWPLLKRHSL